MPGANGAYDVSASARTAERAHLKREVHCVPLDVSACAAHAMDKEPKGTCGRSDD
jgi:hypothetical protein